jgi:hypothetical protein
MTPVNVPQSICRAAVARCDITPPVGMYHRMWGAAAHDRSTGVHKPLLATALVLRPTNSSDGPGVVLIALDHCILGDDDVTNIRSQAAKAVGCDARDVHITLSHTHGAGLMMRDRANQPGGDQIAPYLDRLAVAASQIAAEAARSVRDAVILYATGRCDLAAQRDFFDEQSGKFVCGFNPNVHADDTVMVARVVDRSTRLTLATVVNYACHPTTLAWQNTLVSPDFVGAMREAVETATANAPAPCIFLQGASGEMAPREQYTGDTAVADRNGRRLGFAAVAALESIPASVAGMHFAYTGPVVSGAVLGTWAHEPTDAAAIQRASGWRQRSWEIKLPYRTDLPTLAETRANREKLIAQEQSARAAGDAQRAADLRALVEQHTRQIMRLEALPAGDSFSLRITAWQAGDAAWLFASGEHYSLLQTEIRGRFPNLPILVTTVTDGWQPGYLPTRETYGKGIYQESICMVAAGALERVIDDVGAWIGNDASRMG